MTDDHRRINYLSVCSGIEAATVAWRPLGWRAVAFSEIEPFPCAVLREHYPDVPNLGDMTKYKNWSIDEPIDLLVGGTPCQSFSVAGMRKGMDDPRGNLALVFLGIADKLRPRWLVWENVPGVLSSLSHNAPDPCPPPPPLDVELDGQEVDSFEDYDAEEIHAFNCFLAALSELGYGFAYRVLDAQYFGVAQRRCRVFVVGHLGDWRRAAAVLFERHSLQGHPAPRRKAGKGASVDVAPSVGVSGRGFERAGESRGQDPVVACYGGNNTGGEVDVATACNASGSRRYDFESETFVTCPLTKNPYGDNESRESLLVTHALRSDGFDASEDGTGRGTPIVPVAFGWNKSQSQTMRVDQVTDPLQGSPDSNPAIAFTCKDHGADCDEISPTLRSMGHDSSHANAGGQVAVAFESRFARNGRGAPGEVVPLLKAQSGKSGTGDAAPIVVSSRLAVRRLTPRECERLQGFPDDYTRVPIKALKNKPRTKHFKKYPDYYSKNEDGSWTRYSADGPRYRAIGNSMAVPVMRWIGERIAMVEEVVGHE